MESKIPIFDKIDQIFNYLYYNYSAKQSDISRDLNLPKSTVNRILKVLVDYKYLILEDKKYRIGEKFYFLSSKYEKYNLIKNIAYPYLEDLSLKFKETFKLSILDNDKIRTIAKVESSDAIKVAVPDNAIFPLHAGAASKLLICQLSDSKLNKLLDENLPKYTKNTITDKEELKKELMTINIKKISFDNMEHSKNVKAVALPILDKRNRIIAAISCPFFSDDIEIQKNEEIINDIKKVCSEISKRLNYFNK
ncbi:IclR family transcriptional regulator [Fusobacterium hominis]|mgnify:FL=1|uniref:IclR family transcriptional regulator n=1 Tax=Fusobacterium hominis TaxID=2764326 RepID=A0A7G9GVK6_9FUSO|nr:IclR family transcriptional regulator [Fusobacterium hominis]QNM14838.1 IclR family transcriptional regulator [Fusobacterium hominis]